MIPIKINKCINTLNGPVNLYFSFSFSCATFYFWQFAFYFSIFMYTMKVWSCLCFMREKKKRIYVLKKCVVRTYIDRNLGEFFRMGILKSEWMEPFERFTLIRQILFTFWYLAQSSVLTFVPFTLHKFT